MTEINKLLIQINDYAKSNSGFKRKVELASYQAIQKVQHSVSERFSDGYCMTFKTPEKEVIEIFSDVPGIDAKTLHDAFVKDWKLPGNAVQLRATYYHSTMLLFAYSIMHKDNRLAEAAISLSLFRIWNGRRYTLIKFCNPDIMAYVISNMMSKQYLPTKYATPYDMIMKHFTPTITKKYTSYVKKNSAETKRVIQQVFKRIEQVFKSGSSPNLRTGNTRYTSGLMPLYFKAAEEGYRISQTTVYGKGEDGPTVDDMFTTTDFESITQNVVHSIAINHNPKYPRDFKAFIKKESGNVKQSIIDILIMSFYSAKFSDHLTDIISLMLKRMNAPKSVICSDKFYAVVKKMIISSKHNSEVNQIKAVVDSILITVFATAFSVPSDYNAWSKMSKAQFRKILIYSISYNISRTICK